MKHRTRSELSPRGTTWDESSLSQPPHYISRGKCGRPLRLSPAKGRFKSMNSRIVSGIAAAALANPASVSANAAPRPARAAAPHSGSTHTLGFVLYVRSDGPTKRLQGSRRGRGFGGAAPERSTVPWAAGRSRRGSGRAPLTVMCGSAPTTRPSCSFFLPTCSAFSPPTPASRSRSKNVRAAK